MTKIDQNSWYSKRNHLWFTNFVLNFCSARFL